LKDIKENEDSHCCLTTAGANKTLPLSHFAFAILNYAADFLISLKNDLGLLALSIMGDG
jgi:hypothetical protein